MGLTARCKKRGTTLKSITLTNTTGFGSGYTGRTAVLISTTACTVSRPWKTKPRTMPAQLLRLISRPLLTAVNVKSGAGWPAGKNVYGSVPFDVMFFLGCM